MRMADDSIPYTAFKTKWGLFEYTVLSFGLCNAPAAFQAFLTDIFRAYLDLWLVLFIDDLCIFDSDLDQHAQHVEIVLQTLRANQLYIKNTKSSWFQPEVEFLGHRIGRDGVSMDDGKVQAILNWPAPRTVADVRSFLGLAGFYRHYIHHYSHTADPLTELLKKDTGFQWNHAQQHAFDTLKSKVSSAPVLIYPDPERHFVLTCDASSRAVGAVLSQDHGKGLQPIAFYSRKMTPAERNYPTHDQEMLALITALKQWRHYLCGSVRNQAYTDHKSLTFFARQPTLNARQARWMGWLQEMNVYVDYLPGRSNVVADALSRRPDYLAAVTTVHTHTDFLGDLTAAYGNDAESRSILESIRAGTTAVFSLHNGVIVRRENGSKLLYIPPAASILRQQLLAEHHDSPLAGHLGMDKTYACISRNYWWHTLRQDVRDYVRTCPCCQVNKPNNRKPGGLLQPLPIPEHKWESVGIDFITNLPTTADGHDAIMVCVDRLTKMVHATPTCTTADAPAVAQLYYDTVTRLHGIQTSIISDRDPRFTSRFWEELTKLWGTKLGRSTAFHPQTDGQTERVNRVLAEMLRAYVTDRHNDWDKRLTAAEFAINNATSASTGQSPFYLNYGYHPLLPATVNLPRLDLCRSQAAADFVTRMNQDLAAAKAKLQAAQERQARLADERRTDVSFAVGDRVLLSTTNLRLRTDGPAAKFNPRWTGPFPVVERIGAVAYKLQLPSTMRVHPVFHVSLLKPYLASAAPRSQSPLPPLPTIGGDVYQAERISQRRTVTLNGRSIKQYLVHWTGYPDSEATWEPPSHLLGATVKRWRIAIDQLYDHAEQFPMTAAVPRSRNTQSIRTVSAPTPVVSAAPTPPDSTHAIPPQRCSTRLTARGHSSS